MEERIDEFIWETLSFGRECSDEWWANQKARGRPFLDNRRKYLYSILKEEIEKSLLTINEWLDLHGIDRAYKKEMERTYERNIKGDLEAQLDKVLKILEAMERE